jgi:hypothetical protein
LIIQFIMWFLKSGHGVLDRPISGFLLLRQLDARPRQCVTALNVLTMSAAAA